MREQVVAVAPRARRCGPTASASRRPSTAGAGRHRTTHGRRRARTSRRRDGIATDRVGFGPMTVPCPAASVRAFRAVAATADQLATQAGDGGVRASAATPSTPRVAANAAIAVTAPHLCGHGRRPVRPRAHPGGEVARAQRQRSGRRRGADADGAARRRSPRDAAAPRRPHRRPCPGASTAGSRCTSASAARPGRPSLAPAIAPRRARLPGQPAARRRRWRCSTTRPASARRAAPTRRRARARRCAGPGWRSRCRRSSPAAATRSTAARSARGCWRSATACSPPTTSPTRRPTGSSRCAPRAFGRRAVHDRAELAGLPRARRGARSPTRRRCPTIPDDAAWAHLLVEAATAAAPTAPTCSTSGADGAGAARRASTAARALVDPDARAGGATLRPPPATRRTCAPPTTSGWRVSLIQSNAAGFGSWLVEPTTGINLHNRGLGFNLAPATPPSSARAAGRRTRCARRWRPATASWPPCSGRWAATPSRRSCSSSPPACSATARRPAEAVGAPAVGAARPGDRLRHVDERGPADGGGRGPRADGAGAPGSLRARPPGRRRRRRSTPVFGHAHAIVQERPGCCVRRRPRTRVGSAAGI